MFGLNLASALPVSGDPIDLVNTRGIKISPAFGDSSTEITLTLTPPDNVCPGDTTTGNFRWTTFMMPVTVGIATMTYNAQGPIAPGGSGFASPLFGFSDLSPLVNRSLADVTRRIVGTTTVGFRGFIPGQVAAGQYKIGYACVQEEFPGGPAITHRFWQFILTITPSATGGPAQFVWTSETVIPTTTSPTTSTLSPTTTVGPTTTAAATSTSAPTTTIASSTTLGQGIEVGVTTTTSPTTTTTGSATRSTTSTTTTSSTVASGAVTTTSISTSTTALVASGAVVPTSLALSAGAVPLTASSPVGSPLPRTGSGGVRQTVLWGLALMYFGCLVVLTSRRRRDLASA